MYERVASEAHCVLCGAKGVFTHSPHKCRKCRQGEIVEPEAMFFDFRVALRDANTQKIMTHLIAEMHELMDEYDMHDTLFGEKVAQLLLGYRSP